jgi:hypothetical protein
MVSGRSCVCVCASPLSSARWSGGSAASHSGPGTVEEQQLQALEGGTRRGRRGTVVDTNHGSFCGWTEAPSSSVERIEEAPFSNNVDVVASSSSAQLHHQPSASILVASRQAASRSGAASNLAPRMHPQLHPSRVLMPAAAASKQPSPQPTSDRRCSNLRFVRGDDRPSSSISPSDRRCRCRASPDLQLLMRNRQCR